MAFKLIIRPAAEEDLEEVLEWYNERGKELAFNFLKKFDEALDQVSRHPEQFQKRYGEVRVVFLHIYPYGVHYILEEDAVYILAVLHTKRHPF